MESYDRGPNAPFLNLTLGDLLALSPYTGELIGKLEVRDPVRLGPVVANRTIYVLTDSGRLIALR